MEVSTKVKKLRDAVSSSFFMKHWENVPNIDAKLKAIKLKRSSITPELIWEAQRWDDYETRRLIGIARYGNKPGIAPPSVNGKARKQAQKKPHVDINPPPPTNKLGKLSISAACRWMGAEGWSVEQAEEVFAALDISVALATIVTQLRAGSKGRDVPKISMAQEMAFNKLLPE